MSKHHKRFNMFSHRFNININNHWLNTDHDDLEDTMMIGIGIMIMIMITITGGEQAGAEDFLLDIIFD